MSILLCRFDSVDDFPVLESYTTLRGPVTTRVEGRGNEAMLRVLVDPQQNEPDDATVVIGLPLVAVDGAPERLELTIDGDASRCQLLLDVTDGRGGGLTYSFGIVDFSCVRTCSVDVQRPVEVWGGQYERNPAKTTPPIHLLRLTIRVDTSRERVDVGLVTLAVTGEVWLAPPGIA